MKGNFKKEQGKRERDFVMKGNPKKGKREKGKGKGKERKGKPKKGKGKGSHNERKP